MQKMRCVMLLIWGLAALLWARPASANTISTCTTNASGVTSCTGTLGTSEDVFTDTFVATGSSVTIQTYGFGGGTNAAGETIAAGGFDSLVALFSGPATNATVLTDGLGNPIASADNFFPTSAASPGCPPANTVLLDGSPTCGDNTLAASVIAGDTYTVLLTDVAFVALAVNPQVPGAFNLTDTTSSTYGGTNGAYNDLTGGAFQTCGAVTCLTDTGNFAVDISGNPVTSTPEPGTFVLLGTGLLGIASLRRRRSQTT